jgi:hypothetical protein
VGRHEAENIGSFFRQTANGVIIRDARGSYYVFDRKGRLDHGPAVEGIGHLLQSTRPKQASDNVIDIGPTLRHRQWVGEQFWKPTPGLLRAVKADLSRLLQGTVRRVPVLKCEIKKRTARVARRIGDGELLRLIKLWLKTPIEERDAVGKRRLTGGKRSRCGTQQSGVVSPLLANL